ncbi:MAG: S41 family peptidase [Anaerolineae bacterium]|nr:S41 family peptidase [Anaerolineae bacterium]
MNTATQKLTKALLAITVFVILAGIVFTAGFGSAYVLTGSGILPALPGAAPTATQPPTFTPAPTVQDVLPTGMPTITPAPTFTPAPIPTPASEDEEAFQLFWEAWGIVQRDYYGELPDEQEVTYAAIRGMLNALNDPYTSFIEPEEVAVRAEDDSGEYEGIGAYVDMDEDGKLLIVEPFEGSPAEAAGLQAGDRVIAVDGVSIIGMSLYEAISLVRGPAGSEVTLLVEREGVAEPFEVIVTRERFELEIVDVEMLDTGIGYIRLREFGARATEKMEEGLEELLAQNPRGIVFDLRFNPGGWLDQALGVADLFLSDGVILTQRWKDGREEIFRARAGDIGEDIPLVVLVDRGSASASEIVAGALQDHGRAILIGEVTFGKGAVQTVHTLSDGSQLIVTSAMWFTPKNQPIHGHGLTPDIEVPYPEELEPGEDPQLERAIEYFLKGE